MSKLCRIVYCSRSRLTGSRAALEPQIREIVETARTDNHAAGLTGALTLHANCFAQVLEGAIGNLAPIFARIRGDKRHGDLKILAQTEPAHRLFPHWSMTFVDTPHGHRRHPLAHFPFEAALADGAALAAEQLLDAMRYIVLVRRQLIAA